MDFVRCHGNMASPFMHTEQKYHILAVGKVVYFEWHTLFMTLLFHPLIEESNYSFRAELDKNMKVKSNINGKSSNSVFRSKS